MSAVETLELLQVQGPNVKSFDPKKANKQPCQREKGSTSSTFARAAPSAVFAHQLLPKAAGQFQMGAQQCFINMWSLVSSVKLSPMKKLVSTETKLEKENAIHATPFGNQLDCPQRTNDVHRRSQTGVGPCL